MFNKLLEKIKFRKSDKACDICTEEHKELPEEDPTAGRHHADEIEFNKKNPTYNQRVDNAKAKLMKNLSLDKQCDILYHLNVKESMDERFEDMDKTEEK